MMSLLLFVSMFVRVFVLVYASCVRECVRCVSMCEQVGFSSFLRAFHSNCTHIYICKIWVQTQFTIRVFNDETLIVYIDSILQWNFAPPSLCLSTIQCHFKNEWKSKQKNHRNFWHIDSFICLKILQFPFAKFKLQIQWKITNFGGNTKTAKYHTRPKINAQSIDLSCLHAYK